MAKFAILFNGAEAMRGIITRGPVEDLRRRMIGEDVETAGWMVCDIVELGSRAVPGLRTYAAQALVLWWAIWQSGNSEIERSAGKRDMTLNMMVKHCSQGRVIAVDWVDQNRTLH